VNRRGSVSIVTEYGLDDRGLISGRGRDLFLFCHPSKQALGSTQPPVKWVTGTRTEREADHFNLVPRLRTRGIIPPLLHTSSLSGVYLSTGTALPLPMNWISQFRCTYE